LVLGAVVTFLMRAVDVSGVLFMGSRRVTANRRQENEESGDYSQDIFSVHSP
jgi:hypothetical protein